MQFVLAGFGGDLGLLARRREDAHRMSLILHGGVGARLHQRRRRRQFDLVLRQAHQAHLADLDHALGVCDGLPLEDGLFVALADDDCRILTSIRFLEHAGWVIVATRARRDWRKTVLQEPEFYWDGSVWRPSFLPFR